MELPSENEVGRNDQDWDNPGTVRGTDIHVQWFGDKAKVIWRNTVPTGDGGQSSRRVLRVEPYRGHGVSMCERRGS